MRRMVRWMTTAELARKLRELSKMYGELYYQERVIEELSKPFPKAEYKSLPEIPPEPSWIERIRNWLLAIGLIIIGFFLLWEIWGILLALLTFSIGFVMIWGTEQEAATKKKNRENALRRYDEIKEENEKLKQQQERMKAIQRRILDVVAKEYNKARQESCAMISAACDYLNIAYPYREYAYVCSLHQLLYMGQCENINEAYKRLDREIKEGDYFTNPTIALEQSEQVKINQSVWMEDLLEKEKIVASCMKWLRIKACYTVDGKNIIDLTGSALDYEIIKRGHSLCENYELGRDSLISSQIEMKNARMGI